MNYHTSDQTHQVLVVLFPCCVVVEPRSLPIVWGSLYLEHYYKDNIMVNGEMYFFPILDEEDARTVGTLLLHAAQSVRRNEGADVGSSPVH